MALFRSQNSPPEASPSPGSRARISLKNLSGFTLIELIIVVTVLGILAAFSIPMFVSFIQASQTRGAAQELVTTLNQARQLAITKNSSHSVEVDVAGNQLRFCSGTTTPCPAGTVWTGPGTDGNGWLKLANDARTVCATANPIFSSLGAATTGATLKVQNSQATSSRYVKVSASGRIQTASTGTGTCP